MVSPLRPMYLLQSYMEPLGKHALCPDPPRGIQKTHRFRRLHNRSTKVHFLVGSRLCSHIILYHTIPYYAVQIQFWGVLLFGSFQGSGCEFKLTLQLQPPHPPHAKRAASYLQGTEQARAMSQVEDGVGMILLLMEILHHIMYRYLYYITQIPIRLVYEVYIRS